MDIIYIILSGLGMDAPSLGQGAELYFSGIV